MGGAASSSSGDDSPPKVFINYRKNDAEGWARLLYDRLAARFGADNVFLDQVTLEPGVKWLADIRSRPGTCAAFIALLGPKWASIMHERAGSSEEDQVRARSRSHCKRLGRRDGHPVLVGNAAMPLKDDLPSFQYLWPLLHRQNAELRPSRLDADVGVLIEQLEQVAAKSEPDPSHRRPAREPERSLDSQVEHEDRVAPRPDRRHYADLVQLMVEDGSVVPFLGPGANSSDRTERSERRRLWLPPRC